MECYLPPNSPEKAKITENETARNTLKIVKQIFILSIINWGKFGSECDYNKAINNGPKLHSLYKIRNKCDQIKNGLTVL